MHVYISVFLMAVLSPVATCGSPFFSSAQLPHQRSGDARPLEEEDSHPIGSVHWCTVVRRGHLELAIEGLHMVLCGHVPMKVQWYTVCM